MRDRTQALPSPDWPVFNPEILSERAVALLRDLVEAEDWEALTEMIGKPGPLFLSRLAVRKDRPKDVVWLTKQATHEKLVKTSFNGNITGIWVVWFNPVTGIERSAYLKLDPKSLRYEACLQNYQQIAEPEADPEAYKASPEWAVSNLIEGSGEGICVTPASAAPVGRKCFALAPK